jgi:hypothetical protein
MPKEMKEIAMAKTKVDGAHGNEGNCHRKDEG